MAYEIQIDYGYSPTSSQRTALEMANTVSKLLTGKEVDDTGVRPTKEEIFRELSIAHRTILNMYPDWTFLNRRGSIDLKTDIPLPVANTYTPVSSDFNNGDVTIFAFQISNQYDYTVTEATFSIQKDSPNDANYDLQAVVLDKDYNEIMSSDVVNIVNNVISTGGTISNTSFTQVSFSFNTLEVLDPLKTYYLGLKITATANNLTSIRLEYDSASTDSYIVKKSSGVVTYSGKLRVSYTKQLNNIIPIDDSRIEHIKVIYDYDETIRLLPYSQRESIIDGEIPTGYFTIAYLESTGTPVLIVSPGSDFYTDKWYFDFKIRPYEFQSDNDVALVPENYTYLIEDTAYLALVAKGFGIQTNLDPSFVQNRINAGIQSLIAYYRPKRNRVYGSKEYYTLPATYTTLPTLKSNWGEK